MALLLDFKLDESYTPSRVSVRAGTTVHDLRELQTIDLEEPVGWVAISLNLPNSTCAPARGWLQLTAWNVAASELLKGSIVGRLSFIGTVGCCAGANTPLCTAGLIRVP